MPRKPKTTEYVIWRGMLARCYDEKANNFERYGARGVTVCDRWRKSFKNFLADMGDRPSKLHSLERKENSGSYSPDNCKWATRQEQARNKRTNIRITFNGRTLTPPEWAEETGLDPKLIRLRTYRGWPTEQVLSPARVSWSRHQKTGTK